MKVVCGYKSRSIDTVVLTFKCSDAVNKCFLNDGRPFNCTDEMEDR